MLMRQAGQVETVWDELFPEFVRTLPDDLARLDQVLDAPAVLRQFEQHWGRVNLNVGRPSRQGDHDALRLWMAQWLVFNSFRGRRGSRKTSIARGVRRIPMIQCRAPRAVT